MQISRRATLKAAALGSTLISSATLAQTRAAPSAGTVTPVPLNTVRLKPSVFLTSIEANQRYLLSLDADRLLHNFYAGAGLPTKGEVYGGWESRGIAGHSLGHYHSAVSLIYAQTGDERFKDRARYVTEQLMKIQAAHGDGYAGGTTVDRDGKTVDGKIVYEEVRRGDIRSGGFDLNGGWVPVYTYHKVFAGALDAHKHTSDADALKVAIGLADYLGTIIEGLDDTQLQNFLHAEHGGINEAYAELYSRTKDTRWLKLAERLYHKGVLTPLAEGRDELDGKHANTQIPKVVGLARLYELNQQPQNAKTALFFWETVTKDHSYVIGGNSDHEHFGAPKKLATRLDQQTCEACNTYNMLRLTRHLYGWSGDASYFDFYERAHLNHIMSQQDPKSGMFTYFTPLASGFGRVHSDPFNDFWCCVGSGMESHSKHGESIWWHDNRGDGRLIVNLYYASQLNWADKGIIADLDTAFPYGDETTITLRQWPAKQALALRIPKWAQNPSLSRNNKAVPLNVKDGYATLTGLKSGDRLTLTLPKSVHFETMPDDDRLTAFLNGPLVLAADLGPVNAPWEGFDPVIISDSTDNILQPALNSSGVFTPAEKGAPQPLILRPFFEQHHNRTAVYFRRFGTAEWAETEAEYRKAAAETAAIRAATLDVIRLGEMQPERDHNFSGTPSTGTITHIAERGRMLNKGYLQFDLASNGETGLALQVTYAGRDRHKDFRIRINGTLLVRERLEGDPTVAANILTYALPPELTRGKTTLTVRFESDRDNWTSVYECRLFRSSIPPHL